MGKKVKTRLFSIRERRVLRCLLTPQLDIFGGFGFIAFVCALLFVYVLALSRKVLNER